MGKKLWGGRFSKPTDPLMEEFGRSIQYDYKLAVYDVLGSIAHVEVLRKAGYLNVKEAAKLTAALESILDSIARDGFRIDDNAEDIHTCIQNELEKKAGSLVLKLQTARSRNDQVCLDTKMYCRDAIAEITGHLKDMISSLKSTASRYKNAVIPGFTHMQHAQPVYIKDYLGAYAAMFARDIKALGAVDGSIVLSMGSGALAGTPVDSSKYKVKAGVFRILPGENSLDGVSNRDFIVHLLSALAVIGMHLSRLSEDLIIWSTKEFGFVELDDAYCTGSSLMPQKKNADCLELARGYCGRLLGNFTSVFTMMKGLPLAYNRDMQLDKEPLFESCETVSLELRLFKGIIKSLKFDTGAISRHLADESLYATDIVYYLVNKGVAFKDAHNIVGRLIKHSIVSGVDIKDMRESELKEFSPAITKKELISLFDPVISVKAKRSIKRVF